MYQKILVTLDTTDADQTIIAHIRELAKHFSSHVVLLHVADGWAARTYGPEAVSPEISEDRAYLEKLKRDFTAEGIPTEAELVFGDPPGEIIKWVRQGQCDLVAMSTHGHRMLGDFLFGSTAHRVQHRIDVPVLLVKVKG